MRPDRRIQTLSDLDGLRSTPGPLSVSRTTPRGSAIEVSEVTDTPTSTSTPGTTTTTTSGRRRRTTGRHTTRPVLDWYFRVHSERKRGVTILTNRIPPETPTAPHWFPPPFPFPSVTNPTPPAGTSPKQTNKGRHEVGMGRRAVFRDSDHSTKRPPQKNR